MTLARAVVRTWMSAAEAAIPADVIACARLHMLDAVGVGLAATTLDQGLPYERLASTPRGVVTTLTGARVSDPAEAALINGGLIHSLEFDDTHTASITHGSAVLAPAALAVGELCEAPIDRAVRSYLLGYETLIRIGLAASGAFQRIGFQVTPVGGTLVAALVAADILGASEDERVHAIGIALSQSSGVFEFLTNGSTVKSLHPGWAAHAGLYAARLAMAGLTGPETALEGTRGLYATFAGDVRGADKLAELMGDFGSRWHTPDIAFKFVPCCHYLHPFVEAAGLLADKGVKADDIAEVTLGIAEGAAGIVCEPWSVKLAPPDGHAARWSLPIVFAARLIDGRVDHDTFSKPASQQVRALAARSRWQPLEPNRFPEMFEAEISATLRSGDVVSVRVDDVYGNVGRKAGHDEVVAKFRSNAGRCLPAQAVDDVERAFLEHRQPLSLYARAVAQTTARSKR